MKLLRRTAFISFSLAIVGTVWLILPLRIANPELNQVVSLLAVAFVLILGCFAAAVLPRRLWIRLALALPPGFLCLLYCLGCFLSMVAGGPLVGYEVVDSLVLPGSRVTAYRTNGGATTDYGTRICHEKNICPGIVLVRDLYKGKHQRGLKLEYLPPATVRVLIHGEPKNSSEFQLRRFVCF